MIFVEKLKKYLSNYQLYIKAFFLIAFFVITGNLVLWKTGFTNEISKIFYWPIETGQVAGEYMVKIAAASGVNFNQPYPRLVFSNPNASEHVASICADYISKFNLAAIVDPENDCIDKVKSANPTLIALGNWGSLADGNFPSNESSFGYHIFNYHSPQIAQSIDNATIDIPLVGADVNSGFPRWETSPGSGNLPYGKTGSSDFVVGTNKEIGVITYSPDRFSYSEVDEDNKILKGVGGLGASHTAGSYLRMPIKFVGWAPNVTDVNPYGGDNAINYYLTNKYTTTNLANSSHFDGIWYDQKTLLQDPQFWALTDFDMNWQDDKEQWGDEGKLDKWIAGLKKMFTLEKQKTGREIVITNDGYGVIPPESIVSWHDGFMSECCMYGFWNWQLYFDALRKWDQPGKIIICVDGTLTWTDSKLQNYKNDFKDMRLGLSMNAMGPGYYARSVLSAYELTLWYDEYDVDLGQPTSEPYKIVSQCNSANNRCPYVRFFDNGAVIVNHTLKPVTINQSDLAGLTGYEGPYFRFYGGQDPSFNNGKALVDQPVVLNGELVEDGQDKKNGGDGIILVNTNNYYAVSDILVGNSNNNDTSPASKPVEITGNWNIKPPANHQNPYYSQWDSDENSEGTGYFYSVDSSATAIFRPTIGIGGEYEIFEWHGWAGNSSGGEATNVATEIQHSGGTQNTTINQRGNYGQWNSLGKFNFDAGDSGYVKISANGTDGYVIADAIKFVFTGNTNDTTLPPVANKTLIADLNCDKKVDIIDFGMLLSCWNETLNPGCINNAGCDRSPDINNDNKVNVLDIAIMLGCWGTNNSAQCTI